MAAPLFPLGRIVATPGALKVLVMAGRDPGELLERHQSGDWGDVPLADAAENRRSVLRHGWRILSAYQLGSRRIWMAVSTDQRTTRWTG
jgi:hypothetical protein